MILYLFVSNQTLATVIVSEVMLLPWYRQSISGVD